jgi:MoaA/NifB/PqqE/SkfB family radical SAM enzyme
MTQEQQQDKKKKNGKCVTCVTAVLRDSKLGNYTTHKYNEIYRELFPQFDGVDGSICGSCYKRCYHERLRRYRILHFSLSRLYQLTPPNHWFIHCTGVY